MGIAAVVIFFHMYDDLLNYVIRELEYDPYIVIRVQGFPEYFESVNRHEMLQIFVAIWTLIE